MNINELPPEIYFSIFDLIDKKSLINFSLASSIFKKMAENYSSYRILYQKLSYPIEKANEKIVETFEKAKFDPSSNDQLIPSFINLELNCDIFLSDLIKIIQKNPQLTSIDLKNLKFDEEIEEDNQIFQMVANEVNLPFILREVDQEGNINFLEVNEEDEEDEFDLNENNIEKLNLFINSLKNLNNLKKLKIKFSKDYLFFDEMINLMVNSLYNLEELFLVGTALQDESLLKILQLPNLKKLSIQVSDFLFNYPIRMPVCPKLTYLDLSKNRFLHGNIISLIQFFPNLQTLILNDVAFSQSSGYMNWIHFEDQSSEDAPYRNLILNELPENNQLKTFSAENLNFINFFDLLNVEQLYNTTILRGSSAPYSVIRNYREKIYTIEERLNFMKSLNNFHALQRINLLVDHPIQFFDLQILNEFPNIKTVGLNTDLYHYLIGNNEMTILLKLIHLKKIELEFMEFLTHYDFKDVNLDLEEVHLKNCKNYLFPFHKFKNLRKISFDINENEIPMKLFLKLLSLKNLNQLILNSKDNNNIKILSGKEIKDFIEDNFVSSFLDDGSINKNSLLKKRTNDHESIESKRQKVI